MNPNQTPSSEHDHRAFTLKVAGLPNLIRAMLHFNNAPVFEAPITDEQFYKFQNELASINPGASDHVRTLRISALLGMSKKDLQQHVAEELGDDSDFSEILDAAGCMVKIVANEQKIAQKLKEILDSNRDPSLIDE